MINLLSVDFHNNNYLNYNLYSRNVRYTPYDGKVFDHINVDLSDYPDDIIKLFPVILSPMNGVRFAIKEVNEKKYMIAPQHFFDNIKFFTQEEKKHIFPIYSTKISKKNSNRFYSARIYSASVILNSLFFGYNSRENDPITIRKNPLLDFVVYGFGMRNFFNNTDGINLVRLYSDENIIKSCKKGYHMSYEQFRQYILNVYQLKIFENID